MDYEKKNRVSIVTMGQIVDLSDHTLDPEKRIVPFLETLTGNKNEVNIFRGTPFSGRAVLKC